MRYVIPFIFISVHLLFDIDLGYSTSSKLYTHFTYQFQHTGWIHLLINTIAYASIYKVLVKAMPWHLLITYSYSISVVASFLSMYNTPTVGASGIIYAMIGMFLSISLIGKKLKVVNHRKFLLFILCVAISLITSEFRESVNNACHIFSIFFGLIIGIADRYVNNA